MPIQPGSPTQAQHIACNGGEAAIQCIRISSDICVAVESVWLGASSGWNGGRLQSVRIVRIGESFHNVGSFFVVTIAAKSYFQSVKSRA